MKLSSRRAGSDADIASIILNTQRIRGHSIVKIVETHVSKGQVTRTQGDVYFPVSGRPTPASSRLQEDRSNVSHSESGSSSNMQLGRRASRPDSEFATGKNQLSSSSHQSVCGQI